MKRMHPWDAAKRLKFCKSLLCWYDAHHRTLPWRSKPTPYRVWISEIMLQQTQVKTVIPYFNRFLRRFPDLEALANATEKEILELWSGLGYYSRARNLHRAAKQIVRTHGSFPREFHAILALPGVGRYTAGAICSIAFNQPQPLVDGNIRRVWTRMDGIKKHIPENYFWNRMSALLPEKKASSFNQAMMELGALLCLPLKPRCSECPVEEFCKARKLGIQDSIPEVRERKAPENLHIVTLVLQQERKILLSSMEEHNFIPGEWGLPCRIVAGQESESAAAARLCRQIFGYAVPVKPCARIRHSISHYRLMVRGFYGNAESLALRTEQSGRYRWAHFPSGRIPFISSLFRKILRACNEPRAR